DRDRASFCHYPRRLSCLPPNDGRAPSVSTAPSPRRGPCHFFFPFALPLWRLLLALCNFFALGQPVTPIGVFCLIVAPFCATNEVGIFSASLQRLPGAASAEYLPWGRVSSNVPTGASGTV